MMALASCCCSPAALDCIISALCNDLTVFFLRIHTCTHRVTPSCLFSRAYGDALRMFPQHVSFWLDVLPPVLLANVPIVTCKAIRRVNTTTIHVTKPCSLYRDAGTRVALLQNLPPPPSTAYSSTPSRESYYVRTHSQVLKQFGGQCSASFFASGGPCVRTCCNFLFVSSPDSCHVYLKFRCPLFPRSSFFVAWLVRPVCLSTTLDIWNCT